MGFLIKLKSFSAEKRKKEKQEIVEETVDETQVMNQRLLNQKKPHRRGANNARNDSGRSHRNSRFNR